MPRTRRISSFHKVWLKVQFIVATPSSFLARGCIRSHVGFRPGYRSTNLDFLDLSSSFLKYSIVRLRPTSRGTWRKGNKNYIVCLVKGLKHLLSLFQSLSWALWNISFQNWVMWVTWLFSLFSYLLCLKKYELLIAYWASITSVNEKCHYTRFLKLKQTRHRNFYYNLFTFKLLFTFVRCTMYWTVVRR